MTTIPAHWVRVDLSPIEIAAIECKSIYNQRVKRGNGVYSRKIDERYTEQGIELMGWRGEYAVAKWKNICPCFDVMVGGDSKLQDLIDRDDRTRIEVKTVAKPHYRFALLDYQWERGVTWDIGYLVYEATESEHYIIGQVTRTRYLDLAVQITLKKPSWVVEHRQMTEPIR